MRVHHSIGNPPAPDWLYMQLIWKIYCLLHRRRPSASRNKIDNIRGPAQLHVAWPDCLPGAMERSAASNVTLGTVLRLPRACNITSINMGLG